MFRNVELARTTCAARNPPGVESRLGRGGAAIDTDLPTRETRLAPSRALTARQVSPRPDLSFAGAQNTRRAGGERAQNRDLA
jgi:hypothetical protein